jgi:hypothetical protein
MNIQKKKDKFIKRLNKADNGDTVKVINFKRKHFKEDLSTSVGFGWQDLKEDPKAFYKWLLIENYDIHMTPTSFDNDFGVAITLTKYVPEKSNSTQKTQSYKEYLQDSTPTISFDKWLLRFMKK